MFDFIFADMQAFDLSCWPRVTEEDEILKALQTQWGMTGLAISRGIIKMKATLQDAHSSAYQTFPTNGG